MGYLWLLCIPAILIILLFLPVRLRVEFDFAGDSEKQRLAAYLYAFKVYERIGPGNLLETLAYLYVLLTDLRAETINFLKYLKKHCKISKYVIHLDVGMDDAALTGMVSGAAYTVVYDISALVYEILNIKKEDMDIRVTPHFQEECTCLYFDGIITIRIVHIIKALFMISDIYKKGKQIKINKSYKGGAKNESSD